jgi:hypothetical protein
MTRCAFVKVQLRTRFSTPGTPVCYPQDDRRATERHAQRGAAQAHVVRRVEAAQRL